MFSRLRSSAVLQAGLRSLSYAGGRIPPTTPNVIGGRWVESNTDRWIDVHNPATNQVMFYSRLTGNFTKSATQIWRCSLWMGSSRAD